MKTIAKALGLGGGVVLLACFSGPSVMGASSQTAIGGGGKCVVEAPCHTYCTFGDKYSACDEPAPDEFWCMEFTWSPCGDFEDCVDLTMAIGMSCKDVPE